MGEQRDGDVPDDSDDEDGDTPLVEIPNPPRRPLPPGWYRGPSGGPGNSD